MQSDTANDAAIALAIAEQEHQQATANNSSVVAHDSSSARRPPQQQPSPSQTSSVSLPPWLSSLVRQQQPYMCTVPCVISGICVELMVDSGACTSVISYELAKRLNLESRIDRRHGGVANGVGQAKILGKISGVPVELGHVEFCMDYSVLDVPQQQLLLLGLDQMRKYKCIIDLEQDVLIFGGHGGVQVPMLKPHQQQQQPMFRTQDACEIM